MTTTSPSTRPSSSTRTTSFNLHSARRHRGRWALPVWTRRSRGRRLCWRGPLTEAMAGAADRSSLAATSLEAPGHAVIQGINTLLRDLIPGTGASLAPCILMTNQRGTRSVDINSFQAGWALPRLRPGRRRRIRRPHSNIRRLLRAHLTAIVYAFRAQPPTDVEAFDRLPCLAVHAVLRGQPPLGCPVPPVATHTPDDSCATWASHRNSAVFQQTRRLRGVNSRGLIAPRTDVEMHLVEIRIEPRGSLRHGRIVVACGAYVLMAQVATTMSAMRSGNEAPERNRLSR